MPNGIRKQHQSRIYQVRVWYDTPGVRDSGLVFGSFNDRGEAEDCLIVVAGRLDVKAAQIELVE